MQIAYVESHSTIKKILDETNMFANQTQTPMKLENMEFHPTLTNKLFTDETKKWVNINSGSQSLAGAFCVFFNKYFCTGTC